jgi:polysaccharide chain length determinant protein (PEP-CTERM system associated)
VDEFLKQALGYLRGMWHRRWYGMAAAWVVGILGAVVVFKTPDRYEATARVHLDTQSILRPLMSGMAVQLDPDQQLRMLSRTLISRPNAEKLVRTANLDAGMTPGPETEALVDRLLRSIKLTSSGRENIFELSYRDRDPAKAEQVVRGLVAFFLESSLGSKRKDSDAAQRFIEDQIKIYETRLDEAESRLKEFKLKNMGVTSADGKDYFARMTAAAEELSRAKLELRAAQESRDALKRELAGEEPILLAEPPRTSHVVVPEIDGRLEALRKQLDELLRRYTESHPDVQGTKRVIDQLEAEKRVEQAARSKDAAKNSTSFAQNPVIQQLKVTLAEAEANVASLRARVAEHEARYNQLRASAQRVPVVEAELAQLNRDYEVQKKNYQDLVARRESAALSGEMGAAGLGEFRVIDPPRVSKTPVAPNRLLILPFVLLVALGAGLAVSLIVSKIAPTFHDTRTLREIAQRPVLGSVSLLPDAERNRRKRRGGFAFLGAVGGLVGVYGALLFVLTVINKPF